MYKVEADNLFDAWNQFLDQVCKSRNGDFDKFDRLCRHFYTEVDKCICQATDVFGKDEHQNIDLGDLE